MGGLKRLTTMRPLLLLGSVATTAASPQQLAGVPQTTEEKTLTPSRSSRLGKPILAAVPVPVKLAAGQPSLGVSAVANVWTNVSGEFAGNGSWFIPWWAAAAGGAWQSTRSRPRRRQQRRGAPGREASQEAGSQVVALENGAPESEGEDLEDAAPQAPAAMQPAAFAVFAVPATAFSVPMANGGAQMAWVPSANWSQEPGSPMAAQQQYPQQQQQGYQQQQQFQGYMPQQQQQLPFQGYQQQQQQQFQQQVPYPQQQQYPQQQYQQSYMQEGAWQQSGEVPQPVEQVQFVPCWTSGPWQAAPMVAAQGPCGMQLAPEALQQMAGSERSSPSAAMHPGMAVWPRRNSAAPDTVSLSGYSVTTESSSAALGNRAPSSYEQESSLPSPRSSTQDFGLSQPRWTAKEAEMALVHLRGDDAGLRRAVLARLEQGAWSAALSKHGCHVLQAALEVADTSERLSLAHAFRGHVWEAMRSPHANHVLQKCIELLPPKRMDFVLRELTGKVKDAARHRFGCRVLERLLEHDCCWTVSLVEEVFGEVLDLATHPYGNFVVQHILEHGSEEQRNRIIEALRPEVRRLARHKNASHVIERALQFGPQEAKQSLREALSGDAEEMMRLTHSNYGSFVAKAMRKR